MQQPQRKIAPSGPDLASVFLREFTRHLIINSTPQSNVDPELIERVRKKIEANKSIADILKPAIKIAPLPRPIIKAGASPIVRKQVPVRSLQNFRPSPHTIRRGNSQMAFPVQKAAGQVHILKPLSPNELDLGKLASVLADPAVTGVECPGADKNILVNRSGLVQAMPQMMSKDEIESILKEFSTKTKIPLLPGVFKALHNNFLITAVISEIAGNRFIIEKHFGQPSLPRKEPEPNAKKN